ncbi:hypothetical protein [Streptomyces sp. NBC_00354]|uniref:hypothetical protein n=1 Tax=Streptomyces sp. NBC_00354 TaxID=2975723 RepID=UPI002E2551F8
MLLVAALTQGSEVAPEAGDFLCARSTDGLLLWSLLKDAIRPQGMVSNSVRMAQMPQKLAA